jgi:hypothetical protein
VSDDWVELRDFIEGWVDDQIAAEPDAAARAVFQEHREEIVAAVEATLERDAMAQQARRLH